VEQAAVPARGVRAVGDAALGIFRSEFQIVYDARLARPYDGYWSLAVAQAPVHAAGDALARLRVRWERWTRRSA
jgi:NADH:ubiquinone oxidoreductase subunit D